MNYMENNPILINDFISKLNKLGLEKNKPEFIQNYGKLKEQIDLIDLVLNNQNQIDTNLNIQQLFEILEQNKDKLTDKSDIDINTLKLLNDIVELLEDKINKEDSTILEIK